MRRRSYYRNAFSNFTSLQRNQKLSDPREAEKRAEELRLLNESINTTITPPDTTDSGNVNNITIVNLGNPEHSDRKSEIITRIENETTKNNHKETKLVNVESTEKVVDDTEETTEKVPLMDEEKSKNMDDNKDNKDTVKKTKGVKNAEGKAGRKAGIVLSKEDVGDSNVEQMKTDANEPEAPGNIDVDQTEDITSVPQAKEITIDSNVKKGDTKPKEIRKQTPVINVESAKDELKGYNPETLNEMEGTMEEKVVDPDDNDHKVSYWLDSTPQRKYSIVSDYPDEVEFSNLKGSKAKSGSRESLNARFNKQLAKVDLMVCPDISKNEEQTFREVFFAQALCYIALQYLY